MSWESTGRMMSRGPVVAFGVCVVLLVLFGGCLGLIGYVGSWIGEAGTVAREQFGPRELLRKYEWFKSAAAQLDKKQADISVFESQLSSAKTTYGSDAASWPRDVRQNVMQSQMEVAGIKASYNTLAAEYNAQMAKLNWRFCNIGDLPEGADRPLPREYRTYVNN